MNKLKFRDIVKICRDYYRGLIKVYNELYNPSGKDRKGGTVYRVGEKEFGAQFYLEFNRWIDTRKPTQVSIKNRFNEGFKKLEKAQKNLENLEHLENAKKMFKEVIEQVEDAKENIRERKINRKSFYIKRELKLMDFYKEDAEKILKLIERRERQEEKQ